MWQGRAVHSLQALVTHSFLAGGQHHVRPHPLRRSLQRRRYHAQGPRHLEEVRALEGFMLPEDMTSAPTFRPLALFSSPLQLLKFLVCSTLCSPIVFYSFPSLCLAFKFVCPSPTQVFPPGHSNAGEEHQ